MGKFYGNETAKKVTVQLLRMFIRRSHSESRESCEDTNHAGSDEKIVQVCGRPFAVSEENQIQ